MALCGQIVISIRIAFQITITYTPLALVLPAAPYGLIPIAVLPSIQQQQQQQDVVNKAQTARRACALHQFRQSQRRCKMHERVACR